MIKVAVYFTRAVALVAVFASLFMGGAIILTATLSGLNAVRHHIVDEQMSIEVLRSLSVEALEVADSVLLGLVLFIVGLGMYQLFFPVEDKDLIPGWLRVDSLTAMKEDLVAVTLVMLGISFLSRVVEWDGGTDILYFGASIGIVAIPLVALFLTMAYLADREHDEEMERIERLEERDRAEPEHEA